MEITICLLLGSNPCLPEWQAIALTHNVKASPNLQRPNSGLKGLKMACETLQQLYGPYNGYRDLTMAL